jgi:TolB-like protein/Flp pilus assembly protein TadD
LLVGFHLESHEERVNNDWEIFPISMHDGRLGGQLRPVSLESRLDSWKEIAGYLKRSIRTVQRWEEKESLPVHRLVHDKLGSVYAHKEELDAWWDARGPRLEKDKEENRVVAALPWRTLGLLAATLITAAIAGIAASRMHWRPGATTTPPIKLAVLPFENLSGDPDQDYLSDGLTDEIITELGRLRSPRLGVIARTSVMRYRHTDKSIDSIGAELGVDYILEGSLRTSTSRVRITAQLIRVKDQIHIWADSYDRELRDVLSVQNEVAHRVAEKIPLHLTSAEQARLEVARTTDPEAYEAYLRGRYFWSKRTVDGLRRGIDYFERAIARDPRYALAYVGVADSYALLAQYGWIPAKEGFPLATAAATKALEIEGDLGEAHASQGYVKCHYDWDRPGAEREFKRAVELNPGYATAHQWYAEYLTATGRHDAALDQILQAREIDPLSLVVQMNVGRLLYYARQYDRAVAELGKAVELDPDFAWAHVFLALTLGQKGMYTEATVEARKAMPHARTILVRLDALTGHRAEALKGLEELENAPEKNYNEPYFFAAIYAGLGDKEQALNKLEQAYRDRVPLLMFIGVDPWFDVLRPDPRFQDLVRRVGLSARLLG